MGTAQGYQGELALVLHDGDVAGDGEHLDRFSQGLALAEGLDESLLAAVAVIARWHRAANAWEILPSP